MTNYEWLVAHKDIQQEECLIWPFAINPTGYGCVRVPRKDGSRYTDLARKVMCKLKHGKPSKYKPFALHTCNKGNGDNGCVNSNHLYWGTQSENEQTKHRARRNLANKGD